LGIVSHVGDCNAGHSASGSFYEIVEYLACHLVGVGHARDLPFRWNQRATEE